MTTLATSPVDNPDELALFADNWTTLHKPFADAFRDACQTEAETVGVSMFGEVFMDHGAYGWVNPNAVRLRLLEHPSYEPRQFSALWSTGCARGGYMVKTDVLVPIAGKGSRGNSNKSTVWRRWVA